MNASTRLQLAAAAALIVAAPAAASAAQVAYAVTPVAITAVHDDTSDIALPFAPRNFYVNNLGVSFVNDANVVAKRVTFAVEQNGSTTAIAKNGSFAPGAPMSLELATGATTQPNVSATIKVAKVDFADGSTWTPTTGLVASR